MGDYEVELKETTVLPAISSQHRIPTPDHHRLTDEESTTYVSHTKKHSKHTLLNILEWGQTSLLVKNITMSTVINIQVPYLRDKQVAPSGG